MNTGHKVKALRMAKRMTQDQLASAAKTRSATISQIENGKSSGRNVLQSIAEVLGVDICMLIDDSAKDECVDSSRVHDSNENYEPDFKIGHMLADILTKVGEQNANIRHLRDELRDAQTRLSRLETGLGGGRISNQRGA